eukprot:766069-Karenia_brevis.AAC.1
MMVVIQMMGLRSTLDAYLHMVLARGWRKPALPSVQKRINRCIGFSPGRLRALGRHSVWKGVHTAITGKTIRRDLALGFLINHPRTQCPAY